MQRAMAAFSVLLFSPLIFLLLVLTLRSRRRSSLKLPPGPTHLPILGNLHLIDRALPHRSLWFLSQNHGPLMQLQLGQKPTVVVSSARMATEIFKGNDHAVSRRPALVSNRILTYNFFDVAFSPHNGSYWKETRKQMIRDLLNVKKVQSFRFIREAEVERMISTISASTHPSQPVDLKRILINLTNNISCIAAFGKRYMEGRERERVHKVVMQGAYVLSRFFVEDFLPWLWWIDVINGLYAKLDKSFRDLDEFYEQVIEDHVVPNRRNQENEDYVDALLRAQKDSHLTREGIKGIMMNILFGATDTSASIVAWGMAELMRSPQEMKKCQEEVRRIVGEKGKVDEDDLTQLHYVKSVVKESMRLHPPVPLLIPRECTQQCKIDGYDILPGTTLIINAWAIGRDPAAWDCPDEFLPERFMNSPIDYKGQDFELLPFGSGRRGCPGFHFATPTIELAMANLLYSFDWELPPGVSKETLDMTEASGLITLPKSFLLVPNRYDYASIS